MREAWLYIRPALTFRAFCLYGAPSIGVACAMLGLAYAIARVAAWLERAL